MEHGQEPFIRTVKTLLFCVGAALVLLIAGCIILLNPKVLEPKPQVVSAMVPVVQTKAPETWTPPDSARMSSAADADLVQYGQKLVSHTAYFLGPKGKVKSLSNGMNCQNCHLQSGKKVFGNNYSAVASTYPKFRARSGTVETIAKRVNDCIERSLNGSPLAEDSREMKAFIAYIRWVGQDVEKGKTPYGAGLWELPLLDRAADPAKGKLVYEQLCVVCHGPNGAGVKNDDGVEWKYPPLVGDNSYNVSAGLFRLSRFAGFVKANMPNGATYENPILTDEEAWDVAAYINSLPRPSKTFSADWPDISKKPFDHPFGPFADNFSAEQHKYGPFAAIKKLQKK